MVKRNERLFWRAADRIGKYADRHRKAELSPPLLVIYDARNLLSCYYGGHWRAALATIWWEIQTRWHPRRLVVNAWLRFGDRTGRYIVRDGQRHAAGCKIDYVVEADSMEGVDDDCIVRAMPRFVRWCADEADED